MQTVLWQEEQPYGNPWIFEQIINYLQGKEDRNVNIEEKLDVILKHIELEVEQKGEIVGIKELRKHMSAYIKNMPKAAILRDKINRIEIKNELIACLTEYLKQNKNIILKNRFLSILFLYKKKKERRIYEK